MMKYTFIIILSLMFSFESVFGDEYNERLRKVSLTLTGQLPDQEDMQILKDFTLETDKENFIVARINSYQQTEAYVQKMSERVEELFQLSVTHKGIIYGDDYGHTLSDDIRGSMYGLITDLFEQNKTWDSLLISRDYKFFDQPEYFNNYEDVRGLTDFNFYAYNYGYTNEDKMSELTEYLNSISGEERKSGLIYPRAEEEGVENLAGVITTNRFFTRYPTTRINKNRKRAAAIFRVFLCDSMTPALTQSDEENMGLLNMALGNVGGNNGVAVIADEQKHGEDPQCKDCHHKLDPMAKTFIGSGVYPNKYTTSGELVYYADQENGERTQVRIPVSGLGELGQVITQQPTYSQCQVNHMWNWFVGENVPLSFTKKIELAEKFDELGRRPNDFITYLLSTEEFKNPVELKIDEVKYSHVQSIFKRCDSCHQGKVGAAFLSTGYPFAKGGFNTYSLGQIIWATNIRDDSEKTYMPPADAGWKLEGYERDLLKAWIKGGAKDDNGKTYVSESDLRIDEINVNPDFINASNYKFRNTSVRFLSNFEIVDALKKIYSNNENDCLELSTMSEKVNHGFQNPADGKTLFESPNSALINWIKDCSSKLLSQANINKFLPEEIKYKEDPWSAVSLNNKKIVVNLSLNSLLGLDVLDEVQLQEKTEDLINALNIQNGSLHESIELLHTAILTSQEFLTY